MATKQERFALFRAQMQQYLDQYEAVKVKECLTTFLKDKILDNLVDGLLAILDTKQKQMILPTVQSLIPSNYHDQFGKLVEAKTASTSLEGLSEEEMMLRILDDPSLVENHTDSNVIENDDDQSSQIDHRNDLCPVDIGQDKNGEISTFDIMIAMAEADLAIDPQEELEEAPRRLSVNDRRRMEMKRSFKMQQKGFRSGSFAMPSGTRSSSSSIDSHVTRVTTKDFGSSHLIVLPDYFCCATRKEACEYFEMVGRKPGTFLVREKDLRSGGSFRRRPGQRLPKKAWAISLVNKQQEIVNILVEKFDDKTPLKIGSHDILDATTVHDVLLQMVRSGEYQLKETPFQCHRWYHGPISRKEAEARLMSVPIDGRFLVRESTREDSVYIISLIFNGRCFHNKVIYEDKVFIAHAAPLIRHRTLVELVEYHSSSSNGMQTEADVQNWFLIQTCVRIALRRLDSSTPVKGLALGLWKMKAAIQIFESSSTSHFSQTVEI
eukprot:gene5450-8902_t